MISFYWWSNDQEGVLGTRSDLLPDVGSGYPDVLTLEKFIE